MNLTLSRHPTLRSSLLRMHKALIKIDDARWRISYDPRLTKFEKMVILLEDRQFFHHSGIHGKSVIRELLRAFVGKKHGGASTIDMQLFRTVSDRYERTARRKLRELLGAVLLQRKFSKVEILRVYLDVAYFGTGIYGVSEAARVMYPEVFDDETPINVDRLDLLQNATLASLLVYPKPRLPSQNWHTKIRRRANYGMTLYSTRKQGLDEVQR